MNHQSINQESCLVTAAEAVITEGVETDPEAVEEDLAGEEEEEDSGVETGIADSEEEEAEEVASETETTDSAVIAGVSAAAEEDSEVAADPA